MNRLLIASFTFGLAFLSMGTDVNRPADAATSAATNTARSQKTPTMKVIQTSPGVSVILTESPGKVPGSTDATIRIETSGTTTVEKTFSLFTVGGSVGWELSKEILPDGVRAFRLDGGYSSRTLLVKGVQILELPGNEPAYFDPAVGTYFTLLNSPRAGSAFGAADLKSFTVLTSTRPSSGEASLLDPNYEYTLRKTHDGSAYYAKLGKRSFFKEKSGAPPEVQILVFDMKSKAVKAYKKESEFKPGWRSKAIPAYGAKKGNWVALADWN